MNNRDPALESWDFGGQIGSRGSSTWHHCVAHMRHTRKFDFFDFCAWCVPYVCVLGVRTYLGVRITRKYTLMRFQRTVARLYTTKTRFCSSSWSWSTFWTSSGKFGAPPLITDNLKFEGFRAIRSQIFEIIWFFPQKGSQNAVKVSKTLTKCAENNLVFVDLLKASKSLPKKPESISLPFKNYCVKLQKKVLKKWDNFGNQR